MNTMMDTLTAVQTLQDAGVEESQARAHAQVVVQIVREIQGDLATKADIARLRSAISELRSDFSGLISATKAEIAGLESAISELRSDISGLISAISELRSDISGLRSDISGLRSDISELRSDISELRSEIRTVQWMFAIGFLVLALMIVLEKILF